MSVVIISWIPVLLVAGWLGAVAAIGIAFHARLAAYWRDPVLRFPVLTLESDDWGAGPLAQAVALKEIAQVLARYRDETGRAPTMSLALVLAVPDGPVIAAQDRYHRVSLDDPFFAPVLSALREGEASGVFALQLHGMEHFWPPTLMASSDATVAAWLRQPVPAIAEHLPSPLQSRWVDTVGLPSKEHEKTAIRAAVVEEVQTYTRIFGAPPRVVVPPTFVWTRAVERAWSDQRIEIVVTPGWRYTSRDVQGQPNGDQGPIVNGESGGSVTYLARTDYFEPSRGRDAAHALGVLARSVAEGCACILENHRDNFIFDADQARRSLAELDTLCAGALRQHPDLRFLSTAELGHILRRRDSQWIVQPWRQRLPFVWQRLRHSGRPWKLMRLTGLAALGAGLVGLLGRKPALSHTGAAS
ncbi:MAG: hypothetical protein MUF16_02025 [Burkholderiaceae bacterium]|nr:hypothetical protein [Burkholderiaceae bacterium]